MNIITKCTNIDLSVAVSEYLDKKLSVINKFVDGGSKIQVELEKTTNHHKSGDIYRVELNLWNKGKLIRVERSSGDLYSAIDIAKDELEEIILSNKDKQRSLWKRGAGAIKNLFRKS